MVWPIRKPTFEEIIIGVLFAVVSAFFILQHFYFITWDFSSYVLNSKCLFFNGDYCETQRPPLASFLLAPFIPLGKFGEYIYIFLVSLLFFYACIKSSDALFEKLRRKDSDKMFFRIIFLFFSLGLSAFIFGMREGTEILTLSFIELSAVQAIKGKNSGFYLGLAFLSRYSSLAFIPLLFLNKKIKGIAKNFLAFLLVIFPWLLWNFLLYGNWFTGFIDGYVNNIAWRETIMPFSFSDIYVIAGYYALTAIAGIMLSFYFLFKSRADILERNKEFLLMILISVIILWHYNEIPSKYPRYLFNLIYPVAFFSSFALISFYPLIEKYRKILALIFLAVVLLTSALFIIYEARTEHLHWQSFKKAAVDIELLKLDKCEILSPQWVPVAYYTENVYPAPFGRSFLKESISKNKIILVFREPSMQAEGFEKKDLDDLPILLKKPEYTFYAKPDITVNCSPKYHFQEPYTKNHCIIIEDKFSSIYLGNIAGKICLIINKAP